MGEVREFLRDAWTAAERARLAQEAAADSVRIAKEVEAIQRTITSEHDEIAKGWKLAGITVAAEAGLFLVAMVCANASNANIGTHSFGGWLAGVFGSLGAIIFGLAAWLGVVIAAVIVVFQLVSTIWRLSKIAKCEAGIRTRQAGRG